MPCVILTTGPHVLTATKAVSKRLRSAHKSLLCAVVDRDGFSAKTGGRNKAVWVTGSKSTVSLLFLAPVELTCWNQTVRLRPAMDCCWNQGNLPVTVSTPCHATAMRWTAIPYIYSMLKTRWPKWQPDLFWRWVPRNHHHQLPTCLSAGDSLVTAWPGPLGRLVSLRARGPPAPTPELRLRFTEPDGVANALLQPGATSGLRPGGTSMFVRCICFNKRWGLIG